MQNKKRINVFVSIKSHDLAKKKGLNISEICDNAIQNEAYEDDTKFISKKINEIKNKHIGELRTWEAKLLIAQEKQEKHKQVVSQQMEYQDNDRDAWLPKRKIKGPSGGN